MNSTLERTRRLNILVVDDEPVVADTLVQVLNLAGFNAYPAYSGSQAIDHATSTQFDALISDVVMGGMTGIEAATEICKVLPSCKVLLVSGNEKTAELLEIAHECGSDFEVFAKPVHPTVIIDWLNARGAED